MTVPQLTGGILGSRSSQLEFNPHAAPAGTHAQQPKNGHATYNPNDTHEPALSRRPTSIAGSAAR
jgi:hypothetical protein